MSFQTRKTFVHLWNTNELFNKRVRKLLDFIKNILLCVSKMNKDVTVMERHEGE